MRWILAVVLLGIMAVVQLFAQITPSHPKVEGSRDSFLYVGLESTARFVVISPTGKRAGFENDARVTDIPLSATDEDCSEDPGKPESEWVCSRRVEIGNPALGEYRIDVTAEQETTYSLWVSCNLDGQTIERRYPKVVIGASEKHTYLFASGVCSKPIKLRRIKSR